MAIIHTKNPCSRCGKHHSNSLAHKRSAHCVPRKESPVATKRKPKPAKLPKLKPCPFCGVDMQVWAVGIDEQEFTIGCGKRGCPIGERLEFKSKRLAILSANRRAKGAKNAD